MEENTEQKKYELTNDYIFKKEVYTIGQNYMEMNYTKEKTTQQIIKQ